MSVETLCSIIHSSILSTWLNTSDHPSQQTSTAPPHTGTQCTAALYCSPAPSKQMTSEMMNVVVISPQRCSSGRRRINVKPPRDPSCSLYPCHSTHTLTTAWESQRHLVHHSVCLRKDFERGFFHLDLRRNESAHVVCSVHHLNFRWWNDCTVSLKVLNWVLFSPLMQPNMISGYWGWNPKP